MEVALPFVTVQCSEILIVASLPMRPKFTSATTRSSAAKKTS
jgi:hypothetical protein